MILVTLIKEAEFNGCLTIQELGFTLPFVIVGAALLVSAICTYFVLPPTPTQPENCFELFHGYKIYSLLKVPAILIPTFHVFVTAFGIGFIVPVLEPHLKEVCFVKFPDVISKHEIKL